MSRQQGRGEDGIEFVGQVVKATTLADKGLRVSFDLPETALIEFAWLAKAYQEDIPVRVQVKAET